MSLKCANCNAEYEEGTQHVCAPASAQKCPECGAEFDGVSISHASEKLATLAETNAALVRELDATKEKLAAAEAKLAEPPAPARTVDAPAQQEQKRKRRMLFGASKRAA